MFRSLLFKIIYTVISFLAMVILSNIAMPEIFGVVSLLILNASLLSLITGLGADSMIMHMLANNKWTVGQAVTFAWKATGLQLLIFTALQAGAYLLFSRTLLSGQAAAQYLVFDAIYFIGLILVEKFTALLYSTHKARVANLLLAAIVTGYLLVLLFGSGYFNIKTVLYIFACQIFIQGMALAGYFFSAHGVVGAGASENTGRFLRVSSIVMITNVVQLLAYRIDYWLIKYFHSTYDVGLYSQANKFANLVWLVPGMATQLLIPRFALVNEEERKSIFRAAFYINMLVVLACIFFTNVLFAIVLRPEYRAALSAFYMMLPGYFFWASVIFYAGYFSFEGAFNRNLWGSLLCLVVIAVADFLLIPSYSINGAAVANSIAYTTVFLFYLYLMKKMKQYSFTSLLTFRKRDFISTFNLLKN